MKGTAAKLQITTLGGDEKVIDSIKYTIYILDEKGIKVEIKVYGIEQISTAIEESDIEGLAKLFPYIDKQRIRHAKPGNVDILVGYDHAAYHPVRIDNIDHLVLNENRFGYSFGGAHTLFKGHAKPIVQHAIVLHSAVSELESIYSVDNLGVNCVPKCGGCKCGTCHPGGKDMTVVEEEQYELMKSKLNYQIEKGRFITGTPWIRDPSELPEKESKRYAMAVLRSTEKRLLKNKDYAKLYQKQIEDLLKRKVSRKVSEQELREWKGPKFFITHHSILKPESESTPIRVVYDSSHKHPIDDCSRNKTEEVAINDFMAKGPSGLNHMFGILIRFREGRVAFIGDISKMFHSIDLYPEDHMVRLFLWRDLDQEREPEVYAITKLNMGDKPSAAIAQIALQETAKMAPEELEHAQSVILRNSYMDDISDSCDSTEEARQITSDITKILDKGGFKIKEWAITGDIPKNRENDDQKTVQKLLNAEVSTWAQKFLGMYWDTENDKLMFFIKRTLEEPLVKSTKRTILSKANSIYDPYGFLSPFIIKIKILLRKIWTYEPKIDWDDELPTEIQTKWNTILQEIEEIANLMFPRSIKPMNSIDNSPDLIIFSDGSKEAYGAVAYSRWKTTDGYECRLIFSKSRVAPIKVEDIVRLELSAATLSTRLRACLNKESKLEFKNVYHLIDSNIVKGMINKGSYGFNTFAGNKIGEIHRQAKPEEYFWMEGKNNIADIITRGCPPQELGEGSTWQTGPDFLKLPKEEWPIFSEVEEMELPERKKKAFTGVSTVEGEETLSKRFDLNRFSKFTRLIYTTARVLNLYKYYKKDNTRDNKEVKPVDIKDAERFWIIDAQSGMHEKIKKGKLKKLQPRVADGLIVVGGRTERWMAATWNMQAFILLPQDHKFSELIAKYEHEKIGHLAEAATISKIRSKYWIIGITKIVKQLINRCVDCKKKNKKREQQIMSPLPVERLKPTPAFLNVGVDYFGPFTIKGEVQKRTRGKAFGVIFTCLCSRVIHADITNNYSTHAFLLAYQRFIDIRGRPEKIFSDRGSNLVGASNELKEVIQGLDWETIQEYGHIKGGTVWEFSPGDSPWYNGATEAMVKSVKKALNVVVGENVLVYSELQTAMFDAAQIVNQRPIGRHPKKPEEGSYLCPNDLLIGRCSPDVPQGPFKERCSEKYRLDFVEKVVEQFWKRWIREVFPSLVVRPKWHTERRNVEKGDVVLIEDNDALRAKWKKGVISNVIISKDGKVRRCNITYKTPNGMTETIERAVQKLIVIVPVNEH